MKKKISFFLLLSIFLLGHIAYATTIDLLSGFDSEGDGIVHFGDQNITSFVDNTVDYNNDRVVSSSFTLTEEALSGGTFEITLDHYQASLNAGYSNYFAINGTPFTILEDSASLSGDHDADPYTWYTQTFSGVNSLLQLGSNEIIFYVDYDGNNEDDFEITNFSLTYDSVQTGGSNVPEPGTVLLFGVGLIGFTGISRRKK